MADKWKKEVRGRERRILTRQRAQVLNSSSERLKRCLMKLEMGRSWPQIPQLLVVVEVERAGAEEDMMAVVGWRGELVVCVYVIDELIEV